MKSIDKEADMTDLKKIKARFKNFPYAFVAVDVIFHHGQGPSGSTSEAKKYFSGKHKLYGYKTEVTVLPNGVAVGVSDHTPGRVADITIMQKMKAEHQWRLPRTRELRKLEFIFVGFPYFEYNHLVKIKKIVEVMNAILSETNMPIFKICIQGFPCFQFTTHANTGLCKARLLTSLLLEQA